MADIKKFPKGFMWGSAMSALQSEGSGVTRTGKTAYDLFYEARPEGFYGQATPTMGVDSQRHFKEDLALMAEFGHDSFRNSFSWARLFPDGENVDKRAVAYYHEFLAEAKRLGLKSVMTLLHFDLPAFLAKDKGFLDPRFPELFAKYAEFMFEEFGNDVDIFSTYNEPGVQLIRTYLSASIWPFVSDLEQYVKAAVALVHSHALAVNIFNKRFRSASKAQISFVHASLPVFPTDGVNFTEADKIAGDDLNTVMNHIFMDPMINGKFGPEVAEMCKRHGFAFNVSKSALADIAQVKLDIVGMNYYTPRRTSAPRRDAVTALDKLSEPYLMPGARINPFRGHEIWPEGLKIIADVMKSRYGNIPYWIAENGIPVQEEWRYLDKSGIIQDDYRIAYVSEHLDVLWDTIKEGANCVGYHMWSTYDCWSMANGYKNTYGFFRVDLNTMKRSPKKSAYWFRDLAKANAVPQNYKKVEDFLDLNTVSSIPSKADALPKVK